MSKKFVMMLVLLSLLIALVGVQAASATDCGCYSPGFWKNHTDVWPPGFAPGDPYVKIGDPFGDGTHSLLDALQGGHATRMSRGVVAGWLNAAFCP